MEQETQEYEEELKAQLAILERTAKRKGWSEEETEAARRKLNRDFHLALMDKVGTVFRLPAKNVAECKEKIRQKWPE